MNLNFFWYHSVSQNNRHIRLPVIIRSSINVHCLRFALHATSTYFSWRPCHDEESWSSLRASCLPQVLQGYFLLHWDKICPILGESFLKKPSSAWFRIQLEAGCLFKSFPNSHRSNWHHKIQWPNKLSKSGWSNEK